MSRIEPVTGAWRQKTREMQVAQMDSTIWNQFRFRPSDIIIATYAKAGTTWTQQVVAELTLGGADIEVHAISPWVEPQRCHFQRGSNNLKSSSIGGF